MLKEKSPVVAVAAVVVVARGRRSGAGAAVCFRGRFRSGAAVVVRCAAWHNPGPLPSLSFYFVSAAGAAGVLPSSVAGVEYGRICRPLPSSGAAVVVAASASVFQGTGAGRFRFRGIYQDMIAYIGKYHLIHFFYFPAGAFQGPGLPSFLLPSSGRLVLFPGLPSSVI